MNIQEQEERDYYPATELQNAYALSSMNHKEDDKAKIAALIMAGKHVVVRNCARICPMTDAYLRGSNQYVESVWDSHEEAMEASKDCDESDDSWLQVRPACKLN